jgi:hypothetical protein
MRMLAYQKSILPLSNRIYLCLEEICIIVDTRKYNRGPAIPANLLLLPALAANLFMLLTYAANLCC